VPLHPAYTYYWGTISKDNLVFLLENLSRSKVVMDNSQIQKVVLPIQEQCKKILENLGVPHLVFAGEFIVLDKNHGLAVLASLGTDKNLGTEKQLQKLREQKSNNSLELANLISGIKIRDKAGTFIGARMGRPEKAKMRRLTGSPHTLFPVGEEGGRLRSFQSTLELGKIKADFPVYRCTKCKRHTIYLLCEECGKRTVKQYYCRLCGIIDKEACPEHGPAFTFKNTDIDIAHYFNMALKKIGLTTYPDLIKGVRGTSNKDHLPEHLAKGILRAKHDIYVNKDGTTRYDMTELPITHFKPFEIKTSIQRLRQLGYTVDIKNRPLENPNQLLELKPQDVILPSCLESLDESSDTVLFRIAGFIDELLTSLYSISPFYGLKSKPDLVGHLIIGLAPHTSAGMVGRIIGFSGTQACFAHPLWHAGLRRDCDGDECCVMLLMDALLNFSRQFLPNKRGGRTMDSPLVLTSQLIPSEVDDMVFGLDTVWGYPLELYEAALSFSFPWDIKLDQLKNRLNTELQYEKLGFTHEVSNINMGIKCSSYKTLPSMEEKLRGQMRIAEKIRAVDEIDVARLVIEKHLLKDIKGNLRKFSQQQFRCVKCNQKFRRPPLKGNCTKCGSKIIFNLMAESSKRCNNDG